MNFRSKFWKLSRLLAVGVFLFQMVVAGEAKSIWLRNEVIETGSGTNRAVMAAAVHSRAAVSGLYLVQFNGPLEMARRAELRQAGVELLQYVPDDAFIAKFKT